MNQESSEDPETDDENGTSPLSFPYTLSDASECDSLDGDSENGEVVSDSRLNSPDPQTKGENDFEEESERNEQPKHLPISEKEHEYECPTQLRNYYYRRQITNLYTRVGTIQEVAVTEFLVKLGLPENVTFRIVKYEVDAEKTNEEELCCRVKIAVHKDEHIYLDSTDCYDQLLAFNRRRFGGNTSEYTQCYDLFDSLICDVYDEFCRLLNTNRRGTKFTAKSKGRSITIHEYRKTTRTVALGAVITDYLDEFVAVFQKLDRESQIMILALTRSFGFTCPHADHDECMRGVVIKHFLEGVCDHFNENEEKKTILEKRNAVVDKEEIKIYSRDRRTAVVKLEDVRSTFPNEFKSFLQDHTLGDRVFLLQKWNRILAHRKQQRWAKKAVHKNPREVFKGVVLKGICDMVNVEYNTPVCSVVGYNIKVHCGNDECSHTFGIHEAVQRYSFEYKRILESCEPSVREAMEEWEKSGREEVASDEEPLTKKAKYC